MDSNKLKELLNNIDNKNLIITEFPKLYSYVIHILQNVDELLVLTSVNKILEFYNSSIEFKELLDGLRSNSISKKKKRSIKSKTKNNVSGLILVLDKTNESYKELMDKANKENWNYKGISIVEDFNNIRLYFY